MLTRRKRGSFVRLTRALSSIKRKKKSNRREADQESTNSSICGSDVAGGKENPVLVSCPCRVCNLFSVLLAYG